MLFTMLLHVLYKCSLRVQCRLMQNACCIIIIIIIIICYRKPYLEKKHISNLMITNMIYPNWKECWKNHEITHFTS